MARIPNFWGIVFKAHGAFELSEADKVIFEYVTEMVVEDCPNIVSGFDVKFSFKPGNPYFSNGTFTRHVRYSNSGALMLEVTPQIHLSQDGVDAFGTEASQVDPANASKSYASSTNNATSGSVFWRWFFSPGLGAKQNLARTRDVWCDLIREEVWSNPMWLFSADPKPTY